jgi:Peptidase family M28
VAADVLDHNSAPPIADERTLREVVEPLASLDRTPCSAGEREAAGWIAERLRAAGVGGVAEEEGPSWGTFLPQVTTLGVLGVVAAALAAVRRPRAAVCCAALAVAGIVDEAQNGPRLLRRVLRRRRSTVNVVAGGGDPRAGRTLVVHAHHDAAQTGRFYDQSLMIALHRRRPQLTARLKRQLPQWWLGLAAPLGALVTSITARRAPALVGAGVGSLAVAAATDIWRSPTVPGANDNLSGVAALVALAEMTRERPLGDLRLLLVSCGAEETLQDGIRAFVASHRDELDPDRTWFLNLDGVGSPNLAMLEAEGPIWMEDHTGADFRDLIEEAAREHGIELERSLRARASTDTVIPSRAGYPSAFISSITDWRLPANYHLMSDTPENLDYDSVARAATLAYAVAARLAASPTDHAARS